jgi:hypothetical protein
LLLVVFFIFLSCIVFSLQTVSLLEPTFIIFAPDLLFHNVFSYLTGQIRPQDRHIRHSPDISDLRPDICGLTVLTYLNQVSFMFYCLFTPLKITFNFLALLHPATLTSASTPTSSSPGWMPPRLVRIHRTGSLLLLSR